MMKWIEYSIGLRYVRAKKRNHFISFLTFISMLGIALGMTVIITVLSVMNGFKHEIQSKILDFTAHATVTAWAENLDDWQDLGTMLETHADVVAYAPYIEAQVMLTHKGRAHGAYLRGVQPEFETAVSQIDRHMTEGLLGDLEDGQWKIILGYSLARSLGVRVGDRLTLLSPQMMHTPAGVMPRVRRMLVSGIFRLGMSQYDKNAAFIHLSSAQKIFRSDSAVSGVQLRYKDMFEAPAISRELQHDLGTGYWVDSWTQRHQSFFRALEMEKLLLQIIMTLIVAVAAFNIVSSLIMLVMEKRADIAVLKTMGMTAGRIVKIFVTQGCLVGFGGVVCGIVGGIALALNVESIVAGIEQMTGYRFLSQDVYPITEVPSQLLMGDVVVTAVLAFLLTVLATLYPALRAAGIHPAEALRYE